MKFMRVTALALALALTLAPVSCAPSALQVQATYVDRVAVTANAALPALLSSYEREGQRAIDAAKTREEAEASIARIEKKWAPVWASWEALRAATDVYASALERGGAPDMKAVQKALCELAAASKTVGLPATGILPILCAR